MVNGCVMCCDTFSSPRTYPIDVELFVLIKFGQGNDLRIYLMFLKSTRSKNSISTLNISSVVPLILIIFIDYHMTVGNTERK